MKTTNKIKLGMLTVLTVIFSTTMWSYTIMGNENKKSDDETNIEVQANLEHAEVAILSEIILGEPGGPGSSGELYNFPDPFYYETQIVYTLQQDTYVNLYVWAPGQQPKQLVSEKQRRGKHSVMFNGTGLQAGAYYAILQTNQGQQLHLMTKKTETKVSSTIHLTK